MICKNGVLRKETRRSREGERERERERETERKRETEKGWNHPRDRSMFSQRLKWFALRGCM